MTSISAASSISATRPPVTAEAASQIVAGFGTGSHEVFDGADDMAAQTMSDVRRLTDDIENINNARMRLGMLDVYRAAFTEAWGAERAEEVVAIFKGQFEATLADAPAIVAGAGNYFGTQVLTSGKLLETLPDGGLTLGKFTIEGSGDGMAMRLDSERGLFLKERDTGWSNDGGAAARAIADLRARMNDRPTLTSPVLDATDNAKGVDGSGAAAALAVLRASGSGILVDRRV